MKEVVALLLPTITLFLGAWLQHATQRSGVRDAMRLEAADLLANLPTLVWKRGGEADWSSLNTATDRLRMRLCLAGLPAEVANRLRDGARHFWEHIEEEKEFRDNGENLRYVTSEHSAPFDRTSEVVSRWLADNWRLRRWLRQRLASRRLPDLPTTARSVRTNNA